MTRQHTPAQQWKEAQQMAKDAGLVVREKGGFFQAFRIVHNKAVYLGKRKDVGQFRAFVGKLTGFA